MRTPLISLAVLLCTSFLLLFACSDDGVNPGHASRPPQAPAIISPPDGATGISSRAYLRWQCSDPDNDALSYDLYIGTNPNPPLIISRLRETHYNWNLQCDSVYYWKVVAVDEHYGNTSSPVWSFTVASFGQQAPEEPSYFMPRNNSTNISAAHVTLYWTCMDPDHDPLTFNIYFGTDSIPPLLVSGVEPDNDYDYYREVFYRLGPLEDSTTYYWKVVAIDSTNRSTEGPIWRFSTVNVANQPPDIPHRPEPANGAIDVDNLTDLQWFCSDPDGDAITYSVYFGNTNPPPFIQNQTDNQYNPSGRLNNGTTYYWKIGAVDNQGHEVESPVWNFVTQPGNLDSVGVVNFSTTTASIGASGNYLLVGTYDRLYILDISIPASPSQVGSFDPSGSCIDIATQGQYAYLVTDQGKFITLDISNPTAPVQAGQLDSLDYARAVAVSGNYAYVACNMSGIVTIDIANPSNPLRAAFFGLPLVNDIKIDGNYAYASDDYSGFYILNLATPTSLTLQGETWISRINELAVAANFAYAATNYHGLSIVDISQKENPDVIVDYETRQDLDRIVVSNNFVYAAGYASGILMLDVSDINNLHMAGTYDKASYIRDIYVRGDYIYLADNQRLLILQYNPQRILANHNIGFSASLQY